MHVNHARSEYHGRFLCLLMRHCHVRCGGPFAMRALSASHCHVPHPYTADVSLLVPHFIPTAHSSCTVIYLS